MAKLQSGVNKVHTTMGLHCKCGKKGLDKVNAAKLKLKLEAKHSTRRYIVVECKVPEMAVWHVEREKI